MDLITLINNRKGLKIADLGSGPVCRISNLDAEIYPSDKGKYLGIEYQDMENLTYPDNFFEIVHCTNALDHTKNAPAAVREMIRVSKEFVYINCNLDQHTTSGKKHYWDAKEDGRFINETEEFSLKDLGFEIEYIDNGGERRYNQIIAIKNVKRNNSK